MAFLFSDMGVAPSRRILCVDDAVALSRRRLPTLIHDFVSAGAGDESAVRENTRKLGEMRLQPRVLTNVSRRSVDTVFLGTAYAYPFGIAPMGMCDLVHPRADAILAKLARRTGIPVCVSTAASTSIEEMATLSDGCAWFQLYVGGNPEDAFKLVDRALGAGYETLVLTVDVPEVARRIRDVRNGFQVPFRPGLANLLDFAKHPSWSVSMLRRGIPRMANFGAPGVEGEFDRSKSRAEADWAFLARVRDRWPGRLIVKGVTSGSDAARIKEFGADAIYVSNHGGRQLGSAPAAIDLLPRVRAAVGSDFPLLFDSGIRSGEDIVKARANGADFAMLGRPVLYALAAEGERGLVSLLDIMLREVSLTLAQIGLTDIDAVTDAALFAPDRASPASDPPASDPPASDPPTSAPPPSRHPLKTPRIVEA